MRYIAQCCLYFTMICMVMGCQSTQKTLNHYKLFKPQFSTTGSIYLSCAAYIHCEFYKVDGMVVINEKEHKPSPLALERGILRLENALLSKRRQYGVSLLAGEHEVAINFYPMSDQHATTFHIIHKFMAGQSYKFNMYRQKNSSNSRSLLNVAMPSALCVDLLQGDVPIRRFCRTGNNLISLNDFVEQKL